jgi:hypothetical protein
MEKIAEVLKNSRKRLESLALSCRRAQKTIENTNNLATKNRATVRMGENLQKLEIEAEVNKIYLWFQDSYRTEKIESILIKVLTLQQHCLVLNFADDFQKLVELQKECINYLDSVGDSLELAINTFRSEVENKVIGFLTFRLAYVKSIKPDLVGKMDGATDLKFLNLYRRCLEQLKETLDKAKEIRKP